MDTAEQELVLTGEQTDTHSMRVSAKLNAELIYLDTINPAKKGQRTRFAAALRGLVPGADAGDIDRQLMRLAEQAHGAEGKSINDSAAALVPASAPELEISSIRRPELFFHPAVCGVTVAVMVEHGGTPTAAWRVYLHWSDGRREVREVPGYLDVPGGQRLWLRPSPGSADADLTSWSVGARRAWLAGAAAPDPTAVFRRLCEAFALFLDFPAETGPGTVATLALFVILTYCYPAWPATPYLFVGGTLGSGKTRVLDLVELVAFRPMASSSISASAMFRDLDAHGGVVLYDEAEQLRSKGQEIGELLPMFLAGYKRGKKVRRSEPGPKGKGWVAKSFDVYGPKVLACIAGLPAPLASRCIPITMFRAPEGSPAPKLRVDAEPTLWQGLRDDLHALTLEVGPGWMELAGRSDLCPGLSNRHYELWQPITAVASLLESRGASGLVKLVLAHARTLIADSRGDEVPDADEVLLALLTEAIVREERPRPGELFERAKERDSDTFGRFWSPRRVAARLKLYGIATGGKIGGEHRYRYVTVASLRRIEERWGVDLGLAEVPA